MLLGTIGIKNKKEKNKKVKIIISYSLLFTASQAVFMLY